MAAISFLRRAQNKLGNARHVFLLGARNLPFPLGARVHRRTNNVRHPGANVNPRKGNVVDVRLDT